MKTEKSGGYEALANKLHGRSKGFMTEKEESAYEALQAENEALKQDLLRLKGMARSTFYYNAKKLGQPDRHEGLKKKIRKIFYKNHCLYGYRRITMGLNNKGMIVNHKTAQKLMRQMELKTRRKKGAKYKSYNGQVGKIAPNILNRDFFSDSPNLKMVLDMLRKAFRKRKDLDGLIFHSDQGWHYQNASYQKMLKDKGIIQSMSRKDNCFDNSVMENFFGIMKTELLYLREWNIIEQFKIELEKYIYYYNHKRIKLRLKGKSPFQYRKLSMIAATA